MPELFVNGVVLVVLLTPILMPEFFVNGIVFAVLLTHTNIDARVFRQPSLLFLRYSLGPDCAQNGPVLALCKE